MPYIKVDDRYPLMQGDTTPDKPGELNYVITQTLLQWIDDHGGPNYTAYNTIVGVLECAKLEFYRRAVAPYEDIKMHINGDVGYDNH